MNEDYTILVDKSYMYLADKEGKKLPCQVNTSVISENGKDGIIEVDVKFRFPMPRFIQIDQNETTLKGEDIVSIPRNRIKTLKIPVPPPLRHINSPAIDRTTTPPKGDKKK